MATPEKQNDLLRQRLEDQEDEISGFEIGVAGLKGRLSSKINCFLREPKTAPSNQYDRYCFPKAMEQTVLKILVEPLMALMLH